MVPPWQACRTHVPQFGNTEIYTSYDVVLRWRLRTGKTGDESRDESRFCSDRHRLDWITRIYGRIFIRKCNKRVTTLGLLHRQIDLEGDTRVSHRYPHREVAGQKQILTVKGEITHRG